MYKARPVMQEIAGSIEFFAAAAAEVPMTGMKLTVAKAEPATA
jgi:hypothetical protein